VRFGLTTPVVTLAPKGHEPWEETAGPEDLRAIAETADRLGYHHLSCSEHVAIPGAAVALRGGRYYDPAATLGFVAAVTSRIRLLTHVVVLPYHHPLEVAKRYGTLDTLSGGRVILGVGVGSLKEEFDLLGVEFAGRGPRFEDALQALRAALDSREPQYAGPFHRFGGFIVDPNAVQDRVPIWIGGQSPRSLRRALRHADGWDPFRYTASDLEALLARARDWPEWRDRREPFELALTPESRLDLGSEGQIEAAAATVARYQKIGATVLNLRFRSRSLQGYLEQLTIFAERVAPAFA
jgi:probable F420-dependent oxidoreductase